MARGPKTPWALTMVASQDNFPLLAELLAEQQRLDTPVARFAEAHGAGSIGQHSALDAQLIPLSAPQAGEQYAFEVDLDACSGCKSCVAACHSLNGLDDTETWRDVGLLVSSERHRPFSQTVTTACHHCADPACLNGCPVLAYDKDPLTGIVRHLDDQCIGCSYCILKCPYDVPKFSARLGIVRKCDMCHGRLAHGEAPACAQACPTQAIRIVVVSPKLAATEPPAAFLPGAPDPNYTRPTTRYVTKRSMPAAIVAADAAALRPQPPHWPLIALLILMALAIGCGIADKWLSPATAGLAITNWIAGAAGLALSVLHLGQPRRAWRIFLGVRRSWLSREALVFGAWFAVATAYTVLRTGPGSWHGTVNAATGGIGAPALALVTAALGVTGLFCSVMIYVDTRRQFWRFAQTAPRFFGSAALLGLASALTMTSTPRSLGFGLVVAMFAKLVFEANALAPLQGDRDELTPARKSALLLAGPLRPINELRVTCGMIGGIVLPLMLALDLLPRGGAWLALVATLAGEIAERYLFFRAVDAPKMPGLPAATTGLRRVAA